MLICFVLEALQQKHTFASRECIKNRDGDGAIESNLAAVHTDMSTSSQQDMDTQK